jgi:hypothetical protein
MYTADGQVNVSYSCTACTSASGGIHNVTITTVNGTSGAGSGAQVFVTTVTLQSFSFTGSSQYFRDCNGAETLINPPTYPATSSGACPQVLGFGTYGDHAVYPAGSAMAGLAVFGVNPIPAQSVPGVYVQGATSGYGTFTPTGSVSIPAGQPTFSAPVQDATAFPSSQTQFINPLNINWSVAQAGSSCAIGTSYTCVSASTSSNPIYVTLANSVLPATYNGITNPVMLTYVQLAVGNGGATSQNGAFLDTWLQFTGATVTTWDGRSMQYYTGGNSSCAQTAQNLVQNLPTPSGQCAAFAILLQSALAINGIHSNFVQGLPLYASPPGSPPVLMVIKEWCFLGTPNCAVGTPYYSNRYAPGYAPPWIYRMFLNPISSGDYMYLPLSSYGDLTNMQGVPGQNENGPTDPLPPVINPPDTPTDTPLEKVFGQHFIVQVPTLDGNPTQGNTYFDPSYGVSYCGPATTTNCPYADGFEPSRLPATRTSFFQTRQAVRAIMFLLLFLDRPTSPLLYFSRCESKERNHAIVFSNVSPPLYRVRRGAVGFASRVLGIQGGGSRVLSIRCGHPSGGQPSA